MPNRHTEISTISIRLDPPQDSPKDNVNGSNVGLVPPSITESEPTHHIFTCMRAEHFDKIAIFLAEFIGTGLLVFLGCMSCVTLHEPQPHLNIALTFGLAVMILVNVFSHISGTHINPAVTVAAVIYKLIPIAMAPLYIAAQVFGALFGFGILKLLTPHDLGSNGDFAGVCTSVPHHTVTDAQAFFVEFIITGILVLICCGVWDPRNSNHHDSVPIRFGLAITGLAMAGGPYSGGSMNPARSFAPAVWNNYYEHHWIYWVAPLSAAVIFTYAYIAIFWREVPVKKSEVEEFPLSNDKNVA